MAEIHTERVAALLRRTAASRQALTSAGEDLKVAANVGKRMQTAIKSNLGIWLGTAGAIGLVLAKLPARRKKIYINKGTNKPVGTASEAVKGGLFLSILGIVFKLAQPFLQKLLVQQLGALTEKHLASRQKP